MHAFNTAKFPRTGIRYGKHLHGAFTQHLPSSEHRGTPGVWDPMIEKQLPYREYHCTVDIVLYLLIGLIAHAHRPHAAITVQRLDDAFLDVCFAGNAVERLQITAGIARNDVVEIAQVAFHSVGGTQMIER